VAIVVAALVIGAAIIASSYLGTTRTIAKTSTTTITTTLTSTSSVTTQSTCIEPGLINNGPIFVRVASDSNQTPVVGAQVTATSQSLTFACDGSVLATSQTRLTFTTNNTEWYSLSGQNDGSYSIAVEYSDQSYNLTANLKPVSVVCASLYIPSGRENITTIVGQSACPTSMATATSTITVNNISLAGFSIATGGVVQPTPYLSGQIYVDAAPGVTWSGYTLYTNSIDCGTRAFNTSTTLNYFAYFYQGMPCGSIALGDTYSITFVVTFTDGTNATASISVLAD